MPLLTISYLDTINIKKSPTYLNPKYHMPAIKINGDVVLKIQIIAKLSNIYAEMYPYYKVFSYNLKPCCASTSYNLI